MLTYDASTGIAKISCDGATKPVDLAQALTQMHEASRLALDCAEPAFKAYLHDVHGMAEALTDDNAVAWVFFRLGIRTAAEFRTDETARARWARLRADFEAWRIA